MFNGGQIGLGIGQQARVLLKAKACRLFLQLKLGDALAQRIEFALQCESPFIACPQLAGQVIVLAAFGAQIGFAFELDAKRALQAGLRRRVGQARQLFSSALFLAGNRRRLLRGDVNRARQFLAARGQAAQRKLRLLRLALQRALLLA